MSIMGQAAIAVNLSFQGGLVRCDFERAKGVAAVGGRRGVVNRFSAASRRRLMQLFARLEVEGLKVVFITLTYGQSWPGPRAAKTHRREFWRRLRRRYGGSAAVWRLEFQERGAPHFHMVVFGLPFVPKSYIQGMWGDVIGRRYWDRSGDDDRPPFTRIELIANKRRLTAYVSKYVAKLGSAGGFNYDAYLRTDAGVGRWWGVDNAVGLPLAREIKVRVAAAALRPVYDFRRAARRKWRGVSGQRYEGFTLYVSDAERWWDYWLHLVIRG